MVIKASASAEVRTLVAALIGSSDVEREGAIARLSVIGSRAVARLVEAYGKTADRVRRIAILRALEGIGDHRAGAVARQALGEGGDVAVAAVGVLRAILTSSHERSAEGALDTLVALTVDAGNDRRIRQAAFEALQEMPPSVRARVAEAFGGELVRADAAWDDAVNGRLPDAPGPLREIVTARAPGTPLNTLRKLIDGVRAKEREASPSEKDGWRALRGSLHQSLALRGSRVALYDLRETLEEDAEGGVPPSFVAAAQVLGDRTCLEPLAALWGRIPPGEEHARHQVSSAFQAIAKREKLGKRDAFLKRILAKSPNLMPPA
jgi:hypothetical protein